MGHGIPIATAVNPDANEEHIRKSIVAEDVRSSGNGATESTKKIKCERGAGPVYEYNR
ncbi:hypothetical protein GGD56_004987 [Rhizobium mongolense]|uniref:Uncharacterized protein n=1 Tax=Rhizobium mongolense TaxID=57676 RepID=A0ABR6ITK0_9HYPH|nr:hypothetical protein [Rhizobium mongolense]